MDPVAVQIALFPGSHSQDVTYVHPTDRNVNSVLERIKCGDVYAVLDLRETPYLRFRDISREFFLKAVSDSGAKYVSVYKLMRGSNINSISAFFSETVEKRGASAVEAIRLLAVGIKHGSVFVFSDCEPQKDANVALLEAWMRCAKVEYSPYYWEDG
ncbi:MAG: hypothetical protein ACYDEV_10210 [Acidiferrobacter sp.]